MERRIYWHTHHGDAADVEFVSQSIRELLDHLRGALPDLPLTVGALPNDLAEEIDWHLDCGQIGGAVSAVEKYSDGWMRYGLCVYCPDSTCAAAEAGRRRLPHAFWGINFAGRLSLTYVKGNRFALWHETLHLLGAQDHYDPQSFQTTCGIPTCVMQFAPDARTVEEGKFLCPETLKVLRKTCG